MTLDAIKTRRETLVQGLAALDAQLSELDRTREQLVRNRIATHGALQLVEEMIKADAPKDPDDPKAKKGDKKAAAVPAATKADQKS